MKNYLSQLLVIASLILTGCSGPCKDVECGPGTCDDGTCVCPEGYEGNSCETLENEQFFGIYNLAMKTCDNGVSFNYSSVIIKARPEGNLFEVTIGLIEDGIELRSLNGTLKNRKIDASGIFSNFPITFSGDFSSPNNFKVVFTVTGFGACDFTMTK